MRRREGWLAVPVLALFPAVAHANAGTPLMWATVIHLFLGNALLGVFEGLLLGFLFRTSKWKAVLLLIAANYASAWLGFALLSLVDAERMGLTIQNVYWWQWGAAGVAFLVTLVIEFPFFLVALRKKESFVRKALIACLLIQGISYALLIGWYARSSAAAIVTELDIVSPSEMGAPEGYRLYYIDAGGERMVRSDLEGKNLETLREVQAEDPDDRLVARPGENGGYDLHLLRAKNESVVLENFAAAASVDWLIQQRRDPAPTSGNFGSVPGVAVKSDWEYHMGYWPAEGINGWCENQQRSFRYSLETPFAAWNVRNAVHISGDFVVFQLGRDQICILQPQEKRIALIARGKGPVVAKDKAPAE